MKKRMIVSVGLFVIFSMGSIASAFAAPGAEPAYCDPRNFGRFEIQPAVRGYLENLHVFKLGSVVMAGLAVGDSEANDTARLAQAYGAKPADKFCTWYVNEDNREAERLFNHRYVSNPLSLGPEEAASEYAQVLGSSFTSGPATFLACMEKGYVAMGCNGQKHRGPSVWGMVLAFSGCSPRNAMEIANRIWGLNWVDPRVRLAIVEVGYDLGNRNPGLRQRMQQLLMGAPGFHRGYRR